MEAKQAAQAAQPSKEANVLALMPDNTTLGFGNKNSLQLTLQAANILCKSTLVPKEYQDNLPNCVIALNMSSRMQADPLMVMQNLFIVYNRPGWSSQFLISTFNTCGRFSALRYEWTGEKGTDTYGCKAWATELRTGDKLEGAEVTIDIAKKEGWYVRNGSKWQTMPQQMLMYRAASWFIRVYAPELAMGMQTAEELYDTVDLTKDDYEIKVDQEIKKNANAEVIDISNATEVTDNAKSDAPPQEDKGKEGIDGAPPAQGGGPGF